MGYIHVGIKRHAALPLDVSMCRPGRNGQPAYLAGERRVSCVTTGSLYRYAVSDIHCRHDVLILWEVSAAKEPKWKPSYKPIN